MLGLVLLFMFAALGVLILGLVSMMIGGELNRKYANKLMVARVALQGVAVGLLGVMFLFGKH